MTVAQYEHLRPGDLVRARHDGVVYLITGHYGSHVTAVARSRLTVTTLENGN